MLIGGFQLGAAKKLNKSCNAETEIDRFFR